MGSNVPVGHGWTLRHVKLWRTAGLILIPLFVLGSACCTNLNSGGKTFSACASVPSHVRAQACACQESGPH